MKDTTAEVLTAGVWGLHLSSFIVESMPYLQAGSLILAMAVSLFTLRKLIEDEKRRKRRY